MHHIFIFMLLKTTKSVKPSPKSTSKKNPGLRPRAQFHLSEKKGDTDNDINMLLRLAFVLQLLLKLISWIDLNGA